MKRQKGWRTGGKVGAGKVRVAVTLPVELVDWIRQEVSATREWAKNEGLPCESVTISGWVQTLLERFREGSRQIRVDLLLQHEVDNRKE